MVTRGYRLTIYYRKWTSDVTRDTEPITMYGHTLGILGYCFSLRLLWGLGETRVIFSHTEHTITHVYMQTSGHYISLALHHDKNYSLRQGKLHAPFQGCREGEE